MHLDAQKLVEIHKHLQQQLIALYLLLLALLLHRRGHLLGAIEAGLELGEPISEGGSLALVAFGRLQVS